jgi:hypothetical protein
VANRDSYLSERFFWDSLWDSLIERLTVIDLFFVIKNTIKEYDSFHYQLPMAFQLAGYVTNGSNKLLSTA